jgi:YHYH protein/RTX calcium-binding nonapeptide repeat (4 copies)
MTISSFQTVGNYDFGIATDNADTVMYGSLDTTLQTQFASSSAIDVIVLGGGNDTAIDDGGSRIYFGSAGLDNLSGGDGKDTLSGGQDIDTITGDGGNDDIFGNLGADVLAGGDGNDRIYGGQGGDAIGGNAGDDRLFGNAGADSLTGGAGADSLIGGGDNDRLTGGAGADAFLLSFNTGLDTIADFTSGEDTIRLPVSVEFADHIALTVSGSNTIVSIVNTDIQLAIVEGVINLSASNFTSVGAFTGSTEITIDNTSFTVFTSNGVPDHDTGPFPDGNPASVSAQNYSFKIPLIPAAATEGSETATTVGSMALAIDGVPFYNPSDAQDFDGFTGNAGVREADGFDDFGGHPQQQGAYHYHTGQLFQLQDDFGIPDAADGHSPMMGYSFDGYPIYGPKGYSDPFDPTSGVEYMESSYQLNTSRNSSTISIDEYVLGSFLEDFTYVGGSGDLDEHNGRFAVTPEFPEGIYAYFITLEEGTLEPQFPYIIGTDYYGVVEESNLNTGTSATGGTPPGGMPPGGMP